MVVCTEFFHRGTHTGEFFRRALGLVTGFVHENRVVRQAGAVMPEAVDQVDIEPQLNVFLGKIGLHFLLERERQTICRNTDYGVFR